MTSNDMEIRMKAAELSFQLCAAFTSATIINGGLKNLNEIAPFGLVEDIEKYIRTGEYPKPMKMEFQKM